MGGCRCRDYSTLRGTVIILTTLCLYRGTLYVYIEHCVRIRTGYSSLSSRAVPAFIRITAWLFSGSRTV